MSTKKYSLLMIFLFLILSCEGNESKLNNINRLSGVYLPYDSTVLIYNDIMKSDISFKIRIKRKQLDIFLRKNQFNKIDTMPTNPKMDRLFLNSVRNNFIPAEKIYGRNLQIFKNKKSIMIINYETAELWGLVSNG